MAANRTIRSEKKTLGIERPKKEMPPASLSKTVSLLTAESTPSGMASPYEMRSDAIASRSVLKMRSPMSDQTDVWKLKE